MKKANIPKYKVGDRVTIDYAEDAYTTRYGKKKLHISADAIGKIVEVEPKWHISSLYPPSVGYGVEFPEGRAWIRQSYIRKVASNPYICNHCGAKIWTGNWGDPQFCPKCRKPWSGLDVPYGDLRLKGTPKVVYGNYGRSNPSVQSTGSFLEKMGLLTVPVFIGAIVWLSRRYGK